MKLHHLMALCLASMPVTTQANFFRTLIGQPSKEVSTSMPYNIYRIAARTFTQKVNGKTMLNLAPAKPLLIFSGVVASVLGAKYYYTTPRCMPPDNVLDIKNQIAQYSDFEKFCKENTKYHFVQCMIKNILVQPALQKPTIPTAALAPTAPKENPELPPAEDESNVIVGTPVQPQAPKNYKAVLLAKLRNAAHHAETHRHVILQSAQEATTKSLNDADLLEGTAKATQTLGNIAGAVGATNVQKETKKAAQQLEDQAFAHRVTGFGIYLFDRVQNWWQNVRVYSEERMFYNELWRRSNWKDILQSYFITPEEYNSQFKEKLQLYLKDKQFKHESKNIATVAQNYSDPLVQALGNLRAANQNTDPYYLSDGE